MELLKIGYNIYNKINENYYINKLFYPVRYVLYFILEQLILIKHKIEKDKLKYKILDIYNYERKNRIHTDEIRWNDNLERIEVIYMLNNKKFRINLTKCDMNFPIYNKEEIENYEKQNIFKNMILDARTDKGVDYTIEMNELLGPMYNFYENKNIKIKADWYLEDKNDKLLIMNGDMEEKEYKWGDIIKYNI